MSVHSPPLCSSLYSPPPPQTYRVPPSPSQCPVSMRIPLPLTEFAILDSVPTDATHSSSTTVLLDEEALHWQKLSSDSESEDELEHKPSRKTTPYGGTHSDSSSSEASSDDEFTLSYVAKKRPRGRGRGRGGGGVRGGWGGGGRGAWGAADVGRGTGKRGGKVGRPRKDAQAVDSSAPMFVHPSVSGKPVPPTLIKTEPRLQVIMPGRPETMVPALIKAPPPNASLERRQASVSSTQPTLVKPKPAGQGKAMLQTVVPSGLPRHTVTLRDPPPLVRNCESAVPLRPQVIIPQDVRGRGIPPAGSAATAQKKSAPLSLIGPSVGKSRAHATSPGIHRLISGMEPVVIRSQQKPAVFTNKPLTSTSRGGRETKVSSFRSTSQHQSVSIPGTPNLVSPVQIVRGLPAAQIQVPTGYQNVAATSPSGVLLLQNQPGVSIPTQDLTTPTYFTQGGQTYQLVNMTEQKGGQKVSVIMNPSGGSTTFLGPGGVQYITQLDGPPSRSKVKHKGSSKALHERFEAARGEEREKIMIAGSPPKLSLLPDPTGGKTLTSQDRMEPTDPSTPRLDVSLSSLCVSGPGNSVAVPPGNVLASEDVSISSRASSLSTEGSVVAASSGPPSPSPSPRLRSMSPEGRMAEKLKSYLQRGKERGPKCASPPLDDSAPAALLSRRTSLTGARSRQTAQRGRSTSRSVTPTPATPTKPPRLVVSPTLFLPSGSTSAVPGLVGATTAGDVATDPAPFQTRRPSSPVKVAFLASPAELSGPSHPASCARQGRSSRARRCQQRDTSSSDLNLLFLPDDVSPSAFAHESDPLPTATKSPIQFASSLALQEHSSVWRRPVPVRRGTEQGTNKTNSGIFPVTYDESSLLRADPANGGAVPGDEAVSAVGGLTINLAGEFCSSDIVSGDGPVGVAGNTNNNNNSSDSSSQDGPKEEEPGLSGAADGDGVPSQANTGGGGGGSRRGRKRPTSRRGNCSTNSKRAKLDSGSALPEPSSPPQPEQPTAGQSSTRRCLSSAEPEGVEPGSPTLPDSSLSGEPVRRKRGRPLKNTRRLRTRKVAVPPPPSSSSAPIAPMEDCSTSAPVQHSDEGAGGVDDQTTPTSLSLRSQAEVPGPSPPSPTQSVPSKPVGKKRGRPVKNTRRQRAKVAISPKEPTTPPPPAKRKRGRPPLQRADDDVPSFQCQQCDQAFFTAPSLKFHESSSHPAKLSVSALVHAHSVTPN